MDDALNILRWRTLALFASLALGTVGCGDDAPNPPIVNQPEEGLLVLGIDGMDYTLTKRYMREGRLPNFQRLADMGAFSALATTDPPQSPVAWSTFITGLDPDGHGIYDFVHRDPDTMSPYLSTSKAEQPDCTVEIGNLSIGYCEAEVKSLRVGSVFWEPLEGTGIPATIYKVPANFPPHEHWHTETLSGMGTPDILGTYGTFQVLTDDPKWEDKTVSGGEIHMLENDGQYARAAIIGPPDPYTVGNPLLTEDVELVVDRERGVALVRIEDAEIILTPGEWTEWVPFAYDVRLIFDDVPAMVRFYLKSVDPYVTVYVSPANLDPMNPVMPISSPRDFATLLAEEAGRYYTQGMPEDTKALAADVLSDAEFLQQADSVFEERLRLLDTALDRHAERGGITFFYFSSIDQVSHVFWRTLDVPDDHELVEYRDTIPELYERMDAVLGDVLDRLPEGHELLILSDHGFAPYDYKVHLNTWLYQRGYLALREDGKGEGPLGHIDWSRTQAYALGLNQLFINAAGREPSGHVDPEEREILLRRLERELKSWRDTDTGRLVVGSVSRPDPSTFPGRTPDLIVGYNRGYRSSDTSAMGLVGERIIEKNNDKWSGDHCMDPRQVPGILFSSTPLVLEPQPQLADLPPTILRYFDINPDDALVGRSLWPKDAASAEPPTDAPR